jgi:hypothetical protein
MINLTTFFTSLGIVNGNTQATNFYDFWYGIEFTGGTITYNITEFMTYLGTNRYEFFQSLNSTYPGVFDEYTFYKNIDDNRIYDFYTFYTYAGEYLTSVPITPTPTPTNTPTPTPTPTSTSTPTPTPTATNTPTPTPTNTPTPTPSPLPIELSYISNTTTLGIANSATYNNLNIGGPGLIVITVNLKGGTGISSATIGGVNATIEQINNSNDLSVAAIVYARITATGSTANVQLNFTSTTLARNIGVYRITNNLSDTALTNNSISWTTSGSSRNYTISSIPSSNNKVVITTVTETGITAASGQDITFTAPTTTNYYEQDTFTPNPRQSGAGGSNLLNSGITSLSITSNFDLNSSRGSMISVVFN